MIPSFLLALREGLEAALIIGILLGALKKIDRPELRGSVWQGALAAGLVSLAAAIGLNALGARFEGRAEEIFEGVSMLLAAGLLTWMIFWMGRQSAGLKKHLEADVRRLSARPGRSALFGLAFFAVVREGIELALFLLAARFASDPTGTLSGAVLGLAGAAALGWVLFATTHRLNLRQFFRVTNVLLILFAAGLVGHGVHELNEAGLLPNIISSWYNINPILPDSSFVGEILKALFGYNGNPSLSETLAYLAYFVGIGLGLRAVRTQAAARPLGSAGG